MRRAALIFAIALPLAAQTPTVEGTTPRSTTERPNVSAHGMDQTLTGVLMDATCKSISSTRSDLTQVPGRMATPIAMRQDGQSGANAQSTLGETARTQTEQEQRAMKVYSPQTTGTTGSAITPKNPAGTAAAGARTEADDRMPRLTESGRSSATAGPSQASATGTTGAATATAPTESSIVQSVAPEIGERARLVSSDSDQMTVRNKYRECMVKPSTTSFAMHAGGQLYVLDRASNDMVQEQMRNEAFRASMANQQDQSQWMTVTVKGTPTSDNTLTIRSVRK